MLGTLINLAVIGAIVTVVSITVYIVIDVVRNK